MISAVVLTKNNQESIGRTLKSLLWCDEIIIIDDNSSDETLEKIKNKKIKVYQKSLNSDFASQRNFGLEKAKGDWVLFIDSDEVITPELKKEIQSALVGDKYDALYLKRQDYFMGKWLKFGETARAHFIRFARKSAGQWQRKVHEKWEVKGKIGELDTPILHYPHPTITDFLREINFYSTLHAGVLYDEGQSTDYLKIIFKPKLKFLTNYILRLGILDGLPGLVTALMMSFHSFLSQSKLWQMQQRKIT